MERHIAIIDLGSNTCRLVIFAYDSHFAYKLLDQVSEQVRIGEGMFAENRLQDSPMDRAVQLLAMFHELCIAKRIDRVIATATSAVRDAENGAEFLARVRRQAGLHLRILSGEQEAYYGYLGTINSLALQDGIVADLGGGSLELTRVRHRLPVDFVSLPLGAVRLTEAFLHDDPYKPHEVRALREYVDSQFESVAWLKSHTPDQLVVLGGTMRALAKLDQRQEQYPFTRLHGYQMSRRSLRAWADKLLETPLSARKKIRGLKPQRADIIPAGAAVIARLMKQLGMKSLTVSGQGLREGLF